jgi:hypothetical protein
VCLADKNLNSVEVAVMEQLWTGFLLLALLIMMSCVADAGRPYFLRPRTNHKNSTFQQRYLINDKYWLGAERMGPIFYYLRE